MHDIYRDKTELEARTASIRIQERFEAIYPKAIEVLFKDEASLFTFYH